MLNRYRPSGRFLQVRPARHRAHPRTAGPKTHHSATPAHSPLGHPHVRLLGTADTLTRPSSLSCLFLVS